MNNSVKKGVTAGVATGFLWGLPFLVPQILHGYPSTLITLGRFFFFGLVSLVAVKPALNIFKSLTGREKIHVVFLSAAGFWFYSWLLFAGVQLTDGVISSLIIGILPVSIALTGRPQWNKQFVFGALGILCGLLVLFFGAYQPSSGKMPSPLGIALLIGSLGLWTWFAVANTRFLQKHPEISSRHFASLIGIICLVATSPMFLTVSAETTSDPQFPLYIGLTFMLGAGSSWLANWLWNICSSLCPPSVSGPLIVSETIFGLLYSFMWERRFPYGYEMFAIAALVTGVVVSVRSQTRGSLPNS